MSRQVFSSLGPRNQPDVSAWADANHDMAVAFYHRAGDQAARISVVSYLSKETARELARNLLAACDAIDVDDARQRNLARDLSGTPRSERVFDTGGKCCGGLGCPTCCPVDAS